MSIEVVGQITLAVMKFWLYVIPIVLAAWLTKRLIID